MTNVLVFKKYPNRRLYDAQQSIYVTLGHVAEVIRNGRQVRIQRLIHSGVVVSHCRIRAIVIVACDRVDSVVVMAERSVGAVVVVAGRGRAHVAISKPVCREPESGWRQRLEEMSRRQPADRV